MPTFNGKGTRIQSAKRPFTQEGIKIKDSYLTQGNTQIRVPNRHIVITTLKQSLKFNLSVTCFDISLVTNILLVCAGKIVYVFNSETLVLKNILGKVGATHKSDIRDCSVDVQGILGVTCGEDKRIILWDLEKWKAIKVMEGHAGSVTQVNFGPDSTTIYSSSDDGKVLIWNWKTGTVVSSCMRHPSAVRSFDFNYDRPDMVVCGRNDGFVTAWNTDASVRMDEIAPDPILKDVFTDHVKDLNHCGPILCVRLSLDKQLMATCSADHTCKVWRINSYQKDLLQVKAQLKESENSSRILEGCIDVLDERFDQQLQFDRPQVLQLGEVPISPGYHANLRFTFQHEAPVLSCAFTMSSEYY